MLQRKSWLTCDGRYGNVTAVMTDTNDTRRRLMARWHGGRSWADIAHDINVMAGDRIVSQDTVRRFAVGDHTTRRATVYWIARYLDALEAPASSAATSR